MAKQLIILVHGMGTHPKGSITADFKQALAERAKSFGIADQSFLKAVDYQEFNYSESFDLIREQFAKNAEAMKAGFSYLNGKGFEQTLLKQLIQFEANFGKDEFFYTHWLDVILYSTMYFGEKLRVDFIGFFEKLRKKYGHENIHLVCHSLGTAVVHDALAKYYRTESNPYDDIPDLPTGNFNISSLWTFANVSKMVNILNGLTDPEHSTVVTGSNGCVNDFINIRHKYDPFTWYKPYNRKMDNKTSLVNTVIRKANTHDFYEYVTDPKVARGLLGMIYEVSVDDANFERGVAEHKKGTLTQEVSDLKKLIDVAASDPSIDNTLDAIKKFKEIMEKIDELTKSLTSDTDK